MKWEPGILVFQDKDDVLDWLFDFSDWLQAGETLTSHTMTVETGLTLNSSAINATDTGVEVWLTGGTPGRVYMVSCRVVSSTIPRELERSVRFAILEK